MFFEEINHSADFDFSGIKFHIQAQTVVDHVKKHHNTSEKIVLFMAEKSLHKTDTYAILIMNRYGRSMTIPVYPDSLVSGAFTSNYPNTGTFSCGEKISV